MAAGPHPRRRSGPLFLVRIKVRDQPRSASLGEVWNVRLQQEDVSDLHRLISDCWPGDLRGRRQAGRITFEVIGWTAQAGVTGVVGALAYDALKAAVRSLLEEGRARADWPANPISADEAVERARWHLAALGGDRATVELVGQHHLRNGG